MAMGQRSGHFLLGLCALLLLSASGPAMISGRVVDHITGKPLQDAMVTVGREVVRTDEKGQFLVRATGNVIGARACGYQRGQLPITSPTPAVPLQIRLVPFSPKALYLTFYGIGSRAIRRPALKLIEETELNAVVIDVKGDRGMIPFKSSVPLAQETGAQKIRTVRDMPELLADLKKRGIYTIARIVVFKDNPLALLRPRLAVKTSGGSIWRDREGLAWVDPFSKEVWDYNIDIAIEAAQLGFDEIQFDYMRFPDTPGLVFSMANTQENRISAIKGFLTEARNRLVPYNVFLAADIFGYVCWNLNDTYIGQRLEDVVPIVDYISPMLYPSGFQFGIPGYRNPVAHPGEIVYLSLQRAAQRSGVSPVRFRPWLQAFRDYAFDKRHFTGVELRNQIDAAERSGSIGWMIWNPVNQYSGEGLLKKQRSHA